MGSVVTLAKDGIVCFSGGRNGNNPKSWILYFFPFGSNDWMIDSFVTLAKDGIVDFNGDGKGNSPNWRILLSKKVNLGRIESVNVIKTHFKNPKIFN